jgi:hypothetical protein
MVWLWLKKGCFASDDDDDNDDDDYDLEILFKLLLFYVAYPFLLRFSCMKLGLHDTDTNQI